jgi:hypothetical protein
MTSAARTDLKNGLDEVRLLTAQDPGRAESPQSAVSSASLSNALSRACIVLLSAHLEGYLEDIVTEAMDALASHGALVERLPLLLRTVHAEEHIFDLEPMNDRNSRAPRIQRMFQIEGPLWTTGNVLTRTMLRPNTVCGKMSNPGSREVKQFLDFIGVDIEKYADTRGATGVLSQINGLVGIRNAIAHGEATSNTTFMDIDNYLDIVEFLANYVDSAAAESVQTICQLTARPW